MRRAAAITAALALLGGGVLAAEGAGAAGKKRGKRVTRGKVVRAAGLGGPLAWARASTLRGRGAGPVGGAPATASGPSTSTSPSPPQPSPAPAPTASPTATPAPGHVPPPPPPDDPRAVRVSATEFALTLSRGAVSAGSVRVEFDNSRAEDPHDLMIDPDGAGDSLYLGRLEPGEVAAETVNLPAGAYTLFCTLLDHEQRGMRARLTSS